MITITARNVNQALPVALVHFRQRHKLRKIVARGGEARLEYPLPFATIYTHPRERVLFNAMRDANPFFHFMESLWILAGRNDTAWLQPWLNRIADYSDDGLRFHGAYGKRMRAHDQLTCVINRLRNEPNSTRAVLQIYDQELDATYTGKDMPCNCIVFFTLRDGVLDICVANRSNDLIWGAYGANAVQFSMLQEYVAGKLLAQCGTYTQFSNNTHIYPEQEATKRCLQNIDPLPFDPYEDGVVTPFPLNAGTPEWDTALSEFMQYGTTNAYALPFFNHVAVPMRTAHLLYRAKRIPEAIEEARKIKALDWQMACVQWLKRKEEREY